MPITSKDIAKMAGVSRGTVDRALNNRSGVSAKTKAKIEKIVAELDYIPNRAGKALSSVRRPLRIGIVLNSKNNRFYDLVIKGMEHCRGDYSDFQLEYIYTFLDGYDVNDQKNVLAKIADDGINLLIVTPINNSEIAYAIDNIVDMGIPVVTINTDIENTKRLLHVGCDYFSSGRTAAGLMGLIVKNKTDIAIVTGSKKVLGHSQREAGFLKEIGKNHKNFNHVVTVEGRDSDSVAYNEVSKMLEDFPKINAIYFAASGAMGGMKAVLEKRASNIPVIVACDDLPYIKEMILSGIIQSTVCQEPFRQGYEAIRQGLQFIITGQKPDFERVTMKNEIKIAQNI